MNKQVKEMCRRLEASGLVVKQTKNHLGIYDELGIRIGTLPLSPSDHRWLPNWLSQLRHRTGIDLRQRGGRQDERPRPG
jgi:hypothetical protein